MEPEYSLSVKHRDDIKDISAEESAEEHPEASWTLMTTQSLDHDDDCDSVSQSQERQVDCPSVSYQPFPKHITQVLESFYARGMRGWGKQYRSDIASAAGATGLEQSQIEVQRRVAMPNVY